MFAWAANWLDCALTTQNRWPVGASITHHVCTCFTRFAPSASRRRTSASMSSASMSRCTRLGCDTLHKEWVAVAKRELGA